MDINYFNLIGLAFNIVGSILLAFSVVVHSTRTRDSFVQINGQDLTITNINKKRFIWGIALLVFGFLWQFGGVFYIPQIQQSSASQQQVSDQTQATSQTQQFQSCLDSAKQTFVASTAQLCQQLESEMNNHNIQCPPYPYPAAPNYLTIVKQESDAETLCATLYK